MADEDVLSIEIVGSTMAGSLPFFLVTFQEESATTICHVLACAVKIWSFNVFATPNSHAVVALCTTAAIVPRHEEIKEVTVLEDERSLYGVCARIFRCGVRLRGLEVRGIAARDGAGLLTLCDVHGGVETCQLDAVPERPPYEPWRVLLVNDEAGVYGVPVVTLLTRGHDASLILPHVGT